MQELRVAQERLDTEFKILDCMLTMTDNREHEKVRLRAHRELCSLCTIYPDVNDAFKSKGLSIESMSIYDNTLSKEGIWDSIKAFFKRVIDILLWLPRKIISLFKDDKPKEDLKESVKKLEDIEVKDDKIKNFFRIQSKYSSYKSYKKGLEEAKEKKISTEEIRWVHMLQHQLEHLWCEYMLIETDVLDTHEKIGGYLPQLNIIVRQCEDEMKNIIIHNRDVLNKSLSDLEKHDNQNGDSELKLTTKRIINPRGTTRHESKNVYYLLTKHSNIKEVLSEDKSIGDVSAIFITSNNTYNIKHTERVAVKHVNYEYNVNVIKNIQLKTKPEDVKNLKLYGVFTSGGKVLPTVRGKLKDLIDKPLDEINTKTEQMKKDFEMGTKELLELVRKIEGKLTDKNTNDFRGYLSYVKSALSSYTKIIAPTLESINKSVNHVCNAYNKLVNMYTVILGDTKDGKINTGIRETEPKKIN